MPALPYLWIGYDKHGSSELKTVSYHIKNYCIINRFKPRDIQSCGEAWREKRLNNYISSPHWHEINI